MVWGCPKNNQKRTFEALLRRTLATTNLILTNGGDQNLDVLDASNAALFSIDVCKILIPSFGGNQKKQFQRDCAHVGREVRFSLLASGGDQYFDSFEGQMLIRFAGVVKWENTYH